jgi:hypothetical protein
MDRWLEWLQLAPENLGSEADIDGVSRARV